MKTLVLLALAAAQMHPIESVVQRQLDAYNARDLQSFLSFYSDDAKLYAYPDQLVARGKTELSQRYSQRFEAPQLHAEILSRMVMPPYVIDREYITGLPNGATVNAVVIYKIEGEKIVEARMMSPLAK